MNGNILAKSSTQPFPFTWVNLNSWRKSDGFRCEIYLTDGEIDNYEGGLMLMFHTLFKERQNQIKVYDSSWGDFCLDTWNIGNDGYNYTVEEKSDESGRYITMLVNSAIEPDYSGSCICNDWDRFLSIVLPCILTHQAPYSQLFYDETNDFFFYFHHTGSIGFYYKTENDAVNEILMIANEVYNIQP